MNETGWQLGVVWPAVGAGVAIVIDLALVTALSAVTALSPVALRRISSEADPRLAFIENLKGPASVHRLAADLLQQVCLLLGTALLVLALRAAAVPAPTALAFVTVGALVVLGLHAVVARSLALWRPRQVLSVTLWAVRLAYVVLFPWVVAVHRLFGRIDADRSRSEEEREDEQEEEVEALIEVGERSGLLEAEEGKMMRGIVDLDETLVREIMTPRTEIVAVECQTTVEEARRTLIEALHSRLPVYRETIDNVVGVLHSRDLFQAWEAGQDQRMVASYLRPAIFLPETLSAANLLTEMRQKTQIALVVDEYGGIAGLITLQDVLEEIVGDIRDEHDPEEELLQKEAEGRWVVDAGAHVEELEELFGVEFGDRDFDTVGGLVVSAFGRVPAAGDSIQSHGLTLEVLIADHRRVRKVRVQRRSPEHEASGGV